MTNEEFLQRLAEDAGMSVREVEKVMASFEKCLIQGLRTGGTVDISMGAFKIADRSEKRGINPVTGAEIVIAAKRVVRFRPSDSFNQML